MSSLTFNLCLCWLCVVGVDDYDAVDDEVRFLVGAVEFRRAVK